MEIHPHAVNNLNVAEVTADQIVVSSIDEGSDLLADLYYQQYDAIILHEANITPNFFDLKTRLAGELLQKFSNFRMRLFIIGSFGNVESKSLHDFIFESNKGKLVNFVGSVEEVLQKLE